MTRTGPRPDKGLGQHWLHDAAICARIAALAEPGPGRPILEIGPGPGALTAPLLGAGASVTAVEVDPRLVAHLRERFPEALAEDRLRISHSDARTLALPAPPAGERWTVVSNLPYHAGATILLNLLEQRPRVARMVLMFQAEVARRILARGGDRNHGFLSVLVGLEWSGRRALQVRPGAFQPPPKVRSEVIVLDALPGACSWPEPREAFRRFVDAAFRMRRKQLKNALRAAGYEENAVRAALEAEGLAPTVRAEQVPASALVGIHGSLAGRERVR